MLIMENLMQRVLQRKLLKALKIINLTMIWNLFLYCLIPTFFLKIINSLFLKKMPPEAEAYRVLSGFDNEIFQFRDLLNELSIELDDELSNKIDLVLETRELVTPDSPVFFEQLTK